MDVLCHRYGGAIDHVMSLPWHDGLQMVRLACDKELERFAWDMWLTKLPRMTPDTYISFESFLGQMKQPQPAQRDKASMDAILKAARNIRDQVTTMAKGAN